MTQVGFEVVDSVADFSEVQLDMSNNADKRIAVFGREFKKQRYALLTNVSCEDCYFGEPMDDVRR